MRNEIFDYDIRGGIDEFGRIKRLKNQDALANAIIMWLTSSKGEIIRHPNRGGPLLRWLKRPMTEEIRVRIKESIEDDLENRFSPRLVVETVSVTGDYQKRLWTVHIKGYSPEINEIVDLSETFVSQED